MKHVVKVILLLLNLLWGLLLVIGSYSAYFPSRIGILVELLFPLNLFACIAFFFIWLAYNPRYIWVPLAALVMVALALPFGYTHNRVSGVSLKIFAGVMIGVLFHMLNGLFSNLGAINSWSPMLSALAPSALFLLAAAAMIWWVERR